MRALPKLSWCCLVLLALGCDDLLPRIGFERMTDQARGKAYRASPFFADGKLMQAPPDDTVPSDRPNLPGQVVSANDELRVIPVPVTRALLQRGQNRFEIFCATCHGLDGSGESLVAHNMALSKPPSLVTDPVRSLSVGYVFNVIGAGDGLMPSYAQQLPIADRWAVVSYLRALQRSQASELATLPEPLRQRAMEALR
jgi:mono/diheme cytochrome c family protein